MASLGDIKHRIRSVDNTRQITRAMQMVAAAKLRRAQQRVESARPYAGKMNEMLESLAGAAAGLAHPLFEQRGGARQAVVLFTSDRGLCGSYNANMIRRATACLSAGDRADQVLLTVGKRGYDWFKSRPWKMGPTYQDWSGNLDFERVRGITRDLIEMFEKGAVDRVVLIYTRYISIVSHVVTEEQFLPIVPPAGADGPDAAYIFEPNPAEIFERLLPAFALSRVQTAMTEAFASEHGSRMFAMSNATKNAGEMVDRLTLQYNKARQSSITTEMLEIVSGAEALR